MRRSMVLVSRVERTAIASARVPTIVDTVVSHLTQSTKHIRKSHTPIKPSNPLRELLPRIPGTHQKDRAWTILSVSDVLHTQMISSRIRHREARTWKEGCLSDTKEDADNEQLCKVLHGSRRSANSAPDQHGDSQV